MNPTTQSMGPCPCGYERCTEMGTKLTKAGHLQRCKCNPCKGLRNQRKGKRAEARASRRFWEGGTMPDDLFRLASINVSFEVKTGAQIPVGLDKGLSGVWFLRALRQAEKKLPVGADCDPAVLLEFGPSRAFLVVDVSGKGLR